MEWLDELGRIEYELIDSDVCDIEWFEVKVKGRGNGRRLWKRFEEELRNMGVKVIGLDSERGSEGFWEKMGFRFVKDEKGENMESSLGMVMEKRLRKKRIHILLQTFI